MPIFKRILTLGLSILFFQLSVNAKNVADLLKPFEKDGYKILQQFSISSESARFELYKAILIENEEEVDASIILIKIDAQGQAKQVIHDVSLIGISDDKSLSKKNHEDILMAYAKHIVEPEYGGPEAFKKEARAMLKDSTTPTDMIWIIKNYLKIKK